MSNTTFDQAMEKAVWMTGQGIKVETSQWSETWVSQLEAAQKHPVLLGKVIEALDSEYEGLKSARDEATWMLEHLVDLTTPPQRTPPNHTTGLRPLNIQMDKDITMKFATSEHQRRIRKPVWQSRNDGSARQAPPRSTSRSGQASQPRTAQSCRPCSTGCERATPSYVPSWTGCADLPRTSWTSSS